MTREWVDSQIEAGPGKFWVLAMDHTAPSLDFATAAAWTEHGKTLPGRPDDFPVLAARAAFHHADVIMCSYEAAANEAIGLGFPAMWVRDYTPDDPSAFVRDVGAAVSIARKTYAQRLKHVGVRSTWRHRYLRWQSKVVTSTLFDSAAEELARGPLIG